MKLNLRTRQIECYDYAQSANPPILHRKETFLHESHEMREKFAKLTAKEEKAGLLEETARIGTRNGWNARLAEKELTLRGHQLMKAKTNAPPDSKPV